MSSETKVEKQILATIVYYDILDYPLTGFEIFLYLVKKKELGIVNSELGKNFNKNQNNQSDNNVQYFHNSQFTIHNSLNTSEYLKKHLDRKYGFYFLNVETRQCLVSTAAKRDIVQQRLDRKKLADQKWKKVRKIFWIIQIIPFMKMVLVSGSLAFGNSKDESDIDVVITAKKGRIWIVRTLATLLTSVLGVRRRGKITKNKICLNHYITDQSLKIPFESLYNAQSYIHLINVYHNESDCKLFSKFQEENKWIKKYVENYEVSELENFRGIKRNKILGFISEIFEIILSGKIGNYLEKKLSKIQSEKIKNSPLYKKSGGRITVNNNQLEFHPNSREAKIIPEFNQRMKKLGLFEFAGQKDSGLHGHSSLERC